MRFENAYFLNFLFALPVLFFIFLWLLKRSTQKIQNAFGKRMTPFLTSSVSTSKRKWKVFLQTIAVGFFIIALARPQLGQSLQEVKSEGVEIILAVDVSESMLAEDVQPNRLSQAKNELSRLLDLLPGNKVGIVAFAGSAILLSPLTTDPSALKMYIDSLETNSVSTQGTNFTKAMEVAKSAFERGGVEKDDTTQVSRVIVIASDGEDQEELDLKTAQELTNAGIYTFTLAYGTEKGGLIPERDPNGYLRGYKKDPSTNQPVLSQVKGQFLSQIAESGKGSFFHTSFGGQHLKLLVEDIEKLEKAQFESSVATQYDEKFQIFLLFALVFALIEFFLGERRSEFKFWRGRFEVPQA